MEKSKIGELEKKILESPLKEAQELVNSGLAWQLEGSVGRHCMDLITAGCIMLGDVGHKDYYGNYIPSRHEVKSGTKGSPEFVEENFEAFFL